MGRRCFSICRGAAPIALLLVALAGCKSKDLLSGLPDAGGPDGPRAWGNAEQLTAGALADPVIGVDSAGNAIAVGYVYDDGWLVQASRYRIGVGWDAVETISGLGGETPLLAVDPAGNAVAVWSRYDGSLRSVRCNRYLVGSGWVGDEAVSTDGSANTFTPDVGMDPDGNAVVVWSQRVASSNSEVWARRYVSGTGWESAERLSPAGVDVYEAKVGFDSAGNAIAVWLRADGGLVSRRYAPGAGWGDTDLVGGPVNNRFDLSVNRAGDAVVVWDVGDRMVAARSAAGAGWGSAEELRVVASGTSVAEPRVGVDGAGNAIAVWIEHPGTLQTSRYTAGAGWGASEPLFPDLASGAGVHTLSVNEAGDAVVVVPDDVEPESPPGYVWANQYLAGSGWGVGQSISASGQPGPFLAAAIDSAGNAIAIWPQVPGTWTNRFE